MSRAEFDELLRRYVNKKCTPEEERILSAWYDRLSDITTNISEEDFNAIESKLWGNLEKVINSSDRAEAKETGVHKHNYVAIITGIAATLLVMIITGIYLFTSGERRSLATVDSLPVAEQPGPVVVRNPDAKVVKPVRLADGSLIILQPSSEIRLAQSFSTQNRTLSLVGEAFFEITKDPKHPFTIHTHELVTKVLGTSFNIKANPAEETIVVDVKTGKVAVYKESDNDSEPIYHVTPNQQVVYDRNSEKIIQQLQEDPQIIISTSEIDDMKFDDAPVSEVFMAIEKAYGVELIYDKVTFERCTLTTRMTNEGLKEKLKIICKALGAQYEVQGTSILLLGKGCE